DEGVVDRRVTVRVIVAHHLADDAGTLEVAAVGPVPAVVHRVQDADVDGLQTVADIRQRAADDDRHRVVEEAALHLELDVDRLDPALPFGWRLYVRHLLRPSLVPSEPAAARVRSRLVPG